MKKVSIGGKIVGIIDILIAIILIGLFTILFIDGNINLSEFGSSPNTTMGTISLFSGIFKLTGVISIWKKKGFGIIFYVIGTIGVIYLLSDTVRNFDILRTNEMLPASLIYIFILLQVLFMNIMFKVKAKN